MIYDQLARHTQVIEAVQRLFKQAQQYEQWCRDENQPPYHAMDCKLCRARWIMNRFDDELWREGFYDEM